LHTNGYSLVRHLVTSAELSWTTVLPGTSAPLADLLLEPHRSYLAAVGELRSSCDVRALAHITGGGLIDNVARVLPEGTAAQIERGSWQVPALFTALQQAGGVNAEEMWRTFNMGVGMVAIVPAADAARTQQLAGVAARTIGRIVPSSDGARRVILQ